MDRIQFAKASSASGTIAWLAGTPGQPSAASDSVPFIVDSSAGGLTQSEAATLFSIGSSPTAAQQSAIYPQSVACGDPRADGIVLWSRIDPSQQSAPSNDLVTWQISSSGTFSPETILINGVTVLEHSRDFTVKIPVAHPVLKPFTNYFYRFLYNGVPSRTGQFKTLPDPFADLSLLKLGYIVCQDFGNGYYNALRFLATEEVDYVVHLGDYIYETIASPSFLHNPVRTVPPFASGGAVPVNVDDYRHLYKVYRSDPDQQAVHERFAYIQLWDDHEFANDCHQDFHPDNDIAPANAATPQPALRQAANQAWSEYGLANTPFDPTQDWEHSVQVYRTFSFGNLAKLIITDERLYRDGPPCGSNENGQRYYSLGCPELADKNRTMLGATQRDWFLDQLTTTKATWKLWANEVMLMQLKLAVLYLNLDQWDGYPQERNLILNAVKHNDIKNFVALTGDLHTFLAGYLKTDFDNPFEEHVGIELMVGSITSANFAEEIESALSLPSRPLPAKSMGVPPNLLDPVVRAANPWIQYWDSSTHGYGVLTITPEELICEFKAVSTIQEPDAVLVPLRTFTIPVGKALIHQS